MNISSVIKRVQQLGDLIEKLIKQSNELRERVIGVEENVERATERIAVVEAKVDRQSALVEALAREGGIDPESVYEQAGLDRPPEEIATERLAAAAEEEGEDGTDADADES